MIRFPVFPVIILCIALLGCTEHREHRESLLAIGDSLCSAGWPTVIQDFEVVNQCVSSQGLVQVSSSVTYVHTPAYYDHTVISIGINDAGRGVSDSEFREAYGSLYYLVTNPVCVLPPLSDYPEVQVRVTSFHRIILEICGQAIESYPSDHEDGLHYVGIPAGGTSDQAMADRIHRYIKGW